MIRELAELMDTNAMSREELDQVVNSIKVSVGTTPLDFEKASQMYNLDFFRGEGEEFRMRICTMLAQHWPKLTNLFWIKAAGAMLPASLPEPEPELMIPMDVEEPITINPFPAADGEGEGDDVMAEMIVDQIEPIPEQQGPQD